MANLRLEGSSTSARAIASTRDKAGRAREGTKTDQRGPRHPPSAAACEKLALTKLYKKSPRGPTSEACRRTYAHLPALHEAYQINSALQEKGLGRSRGFGFVEMPNADEGTAAIASLNGAELQNRPLTVNEARPREPRRDGRREEY